MTIIKEERLKWRTKQGFAGVKEDILVSHKEDQHLKRVDDAKKSAIHQSRDYEEFKDLVSTCHLKPIQKNEFNAPAKRISPNSLFNGRTSEPSAQHATVKLSEYYQAAIDKQEFYRNLSRLQGEDKWEFVMMHDTHTLESWFHSGMDEGVFGDLVNTIDASDTTASTVIRSFSKFAWFSRAAEFLTAAERAKLSL